MNFGLTLQINLLALYYLRSIGQLKSLEFLIQMLVVLENHQPSYRLVTDKISSVVLPQRLNWCYSNIR